MEKLPKKPSRSQLIASQWRLVGLNTPLLALILFVGAALGSYSVYRKLGSLEKQVAFQRQIIAELREKKQEKEALITLRDKRILDLIDSRFSLIQSELKDKDIVGIKSKTKIAFVEPKTLRQMSLDEYKSPYKSFETLDEFKEDLLNKRVSFRLKLSEMKEAYLASEDVLGEAQNNYHEFLEARADLVSRFDHFQKEELRQWKIYHHTRAKRPKSIVQNLMADLSEI